MKNSLFIFFLILILPPLLFAKGKQKTNYCADEVEKCDSTTLTELQKIIRKQLTLRAAQMSHYAKIFNNKPTQSGNCFNHNDPTVAVNASEEGKIGDVIKIENEGRIRYALVLDTGHLKKSQKKSSKKKRGPPRSQKVRELDSSNSLFSQLREPKTKKKDLMNVKWGSLSHFEDGSKYETIIACLKKLNAEAAERDPNTQTHTSSGEQPASSEAGK